MLTFPNLSTGAVTQYPCGIANVQASEVIRFIDGTDQRYLLQPEALRQWHIRLDLLSEKEIQRLEEFFASQAGDYSPFSFPDPYSGEAVPNCRFGNPEFLGEYTSSEASATSFWVVESRG